MKKVNTIREAIQLRYPDIAKKLESYNSVEEAEKAEAINYEEVSRLFWFVTLDVFPIKK